MMKNGLLTDKAISILVSMRTGVQSALEEDRYNIQRALEKLEAERQAKMPADVAVREPEKAA